MFRVFEEINTFIQQECIKLIKSDHKDISNKDFHSDSEDWSNDADNSGLYHRNKLQNKIYSNINNLF